MLAELIDHLSDFVSKRRLELFDKVLDYRTRYLNLVCEDIYQGHNASALLRTCECLGIQDIHILEARNNFEINSEIALGASNWLTIQRHNRVNDTYAIFKELRSKGCRIVATTPHKQGVRLSEFDLEKGPASIIFGTEKEGLSAELIHEADEFITIDMYGFTESLNVSVSAGIILQYLRFKLMQSDIKWQLDQNERKMIKLDWLRKSIKRSDLIEKKFNNENFCR